jgi:hypothetical protein
LKWPGDDWDDGLVPVLVAWIDVRRCVRRRRTAKGENTFVNGSREMDPDRGAADGIDPRLTVG